MNRMTVPAIAALLLSSPASAALVDICFIERTDFTDVINGDAVQAEYDTGQYRVFRIVAVFDHPDDELVGGIGSFNFPLVLEPSADSPIFQGPDEPNGWHRPSESANLSDPTNEFDTFVVIGIETSPILAGQADPENATYYAGPFGAGLNMNDGAWLDAPGNGVGVAGDDLMVDLAQITVQGTSFFPSLTGMVNYTDGSTGENITVAFSTFPFCGAPYDLNSDFIVNVFDLLVLLSNWGTDDDGAALAAPFNIVSVSDLLVLLEHWGESIPHKPNTTE